MGLYGPRFLSAPKGSRVGVYYAMQREAAMAHTVEEWMKLGEENRIPIMRANALDEVLNDPHLKAVDFFQVLEHPSEGGWRAMHPPVKFSKTNHLPEVITQVQQVQNGRWTVIKEGLMF